MRFLQFYAVFGTANRKMEKKSWLNRHKVSVAVAVAIIAVGSYMLPSFSNKQMNVETQRLVTAPVTSGVFQDVIPVRGRVVPATTVFLDAVEGGRVERILVEDGMELQAGDLIVELSNPTLESTRLAHSLSNAENHSIKESDVKGSAAEVAACKFFHGNSPMTIIWS